MGIDFDVLLTLIYDAAERRVSISLSLARDKTYITASDSSGYRVCDGIGMFIRNARIRMIIALEISAARTPIRRGNHSTSGSMGPA